MTTKHIIHIATAAMMLTACSSDEPGADRLPDGKYPLTMTATVGSPLSRAEGKEWWDGGEKIAVSIGDYTGQYTIHANGKVTAAEAPYYWKNTTKATVSAWWPYATDEQTYDIADQSEGYADFDFLYAETEGSYAAPVQLAFDHQMAKVSYTLVKGKGITYDEFAGASVTLLGDKSVTVTHGKITGTATSQTDEIAPCHDGDTHTGSAILAPQNMTGHPLIRVSFGGNDFYYIPDTETAGNLQGGYHYSYTITVKANGIEVTAAAGGQWADDGSEDIGSAKIYAASELKVGDFYYSDGTTSDGGLRKLHADGIIEWTETRPNPESGKTVIGIVIYAGQHPNDKSDYTQSGIGDKNCHGYAVAMTDATSEKCMWGKPDVLGCGPTDGNGNLLDNHNNPDSDWSGYKWTQTIITAAGGKDNLNATEQAGYPATWYAVVDYPKKVAAPTGSSGWFLPSIGQLRNICQNNSSLFSSVSGAEGLSNWYYLSSSEPSVFPDGVSVVYAPGVSIISGGKYYESFYVRPVLAF